MTESRIENRKQSNTKNGNEFELRKSSRTETPKKTKNPKIPESESEAILRRLPKLHPKINFQHFYWYTLKS